MIKLVIQRKLTLRSSKLRGSLCVAKLSNLCSIIKSCAKLDKLKTSN